VLHDRVEIPLKNYDFSGRLPLLGSGAKRFVPNTIEELQKFVKKCSQEGTRIRVVGGANSYSPIIQSAENGALVSLFNIDHLISVDKGKKQVTVEAGIRERDLHDIISEFGWSLPQVTRKFNILAGGLNSGHHSSGYDIPEVASAIVVGMKIVDGSGDLIVAEPGDDLFYAALVGLGRLGIVVEYTLQCTDKFYLKAVGVRKKTETLLSTMVDEAPHKKFWRLIFFPYTAYGYDLSLNSHFNDNELIFEKRQDNWASKYDFLYDFTSEWLSFHGYLTSLFRTLVRPLNKLQVAVIGDRVEMTGRRSDWMLAAGTGASEPPHDSYEIAFPLEKCEDAVRMIMDGLEARTISYPWCEVRVSGPSPAWLSPAYGKRICWYELPTYHQDDETHQYIIDLMQKAAEKYDGRPHWGKLNVYACSRSFLQEQYARFNDFTKMVQKMDPKGTFSSPWFDKIFNIDPDEPATQEISIIPLMDQVFASHHHSALLVFTRLNLFSFISDSNGVTVEILADHAKWTQRATSAMIISLTTSGILKESTQTCGTSTFYLSPLGERFLLQKNAGHMNDFLDLFWDHSPKTLLEKASIGTEKENFMLKTGGGAPSEFFINAMQGQTSFAAKVLAPLIRLEPTTRVVDVGGGSGTFVIEICKNNPSATGIIYELPDVVPIAEKYVKQVRPTVYYLSSIL